MKITTYNQAIKIYMEVLINIIENNLFLFDDEHNKLKITITELGFQKEIIEYNQNLLPNTKKEPISISELLVILSTNIDKLIDIYEIKMNSSNKYAYLPDIKKTISKKYYNSYQEIALILNKIMMLKNANRYNKDPKIAYYQEIEENKLPKKITDFTKIEIKTIECYAILEEELINRTKDLLWDLENQNNEQYIEWEDFQNCILYNTSNKVK